MAIPAVIVAVGAIGGGLIASSGARSAASTQAAAAGAASQAQMEATRMGVEEQRRQFDQIQKILRPFVDAGAAQLPALAGYTRVGQPALDQQAALAGLEGPEAQRLAIQQIEQSPQMQAMTQQGEAAMLQQASATGGLRGGNLQGALAQFRPQLLSQLIDQQYARLGGLAGFGQTSAQNLAQMGQAGAAGQAAAGMQTGTSIANLYNQGGAAQAAGLTQAGAAQAGGQLAQANIFGGTVAQLGGLAASHFGRPNYAGVRADLDQAMATSGLW